MPSVWFSVGIAAILQVCSAAAAADATARSASLDIRVAPGDWGDVRPRDIETVLTSVAVTLLPYFPQRAAERIAVTYSADGPSVLLEKTPEGAHRVSLNVQGARWDQFTYQFSHELCHIFTNHEHRETGPGELARDHQWFEETLCEAVSLFALERMATAWTQSPPHPGWDSYAGAFHDYAQQLLQSRHRRLPADETLDQWFKANRDALERNPYLRQKNELLAARLLPLFENAPDNLVAIGYLNAEKSPPPQSFAAYLDSWYSCCPETQRAFVIRVMSLLEGQQRERPAPRPAA